MTTTRCLILAIGTLLLTTTDAAAQYRGRSYGYRPAYNTYRPAYNPAEYHGNIGLPNPLSNPAFNYWYHNGPRYWNGSAWMVAPMPTGYPYGYGVNPYLYNYASPVYNTTNVINNSVNASGQTVADNDIHIYLPDPNAKVYVNGTLFPGFGTDRHLTMNNVVVGAKHEVTVKATWSGDGKEHSKEAVVHLDGTGHATLYWFDAK